MKTHTLLKSGFRYMLIASLLASLGMMTGCKRSNMLKDEATPNKTVAPLQAGQRQIDCDNTTEECKTVDKRATQ